MGSLGETRSPGNLLRPTNTDCLNTSVFAEPGGPDTVRIVLSCLTATCIICLSVAAVVLFRLRETKVMRNTLSLSSVQCSTSKY